jgi:hypothetical protein
MMWVLETAAATARNGHWCLMSPTKSMGSEVADRLVMTTAEQCSDLDQETARIRASGRILQLQGEDYGEARREATA